MNVEQKERLKKIEILIIKNMMFMKSKKDVDLVQIILDLNSYEIPNLSSSEVLERIQYLIDSERLERDSEKPSVINYLA